MNKDKKLTHEERVFETFSENLIENLGYLEGQNVNWFKGISLAAYHLMEFGCYHSKGDITQISIIFLHAIAASGFRRHELQEYGEENQISINVETGLSLEDDCHKACLLTVVTILEIFEEFLERRSQSRNKMH